MSAIAIRDQTSSNRVLKAVIIYDDFDAATRATALLERVGVRADEAIKWDIKPWRFEVLKQPTLASLTVAVAANADLIVLTLDHIHSERAELLTWLKNWAEHRRIEDAAVLALFSSLTQTKSESWNELKQFTEGYGLAFLDSDNVWNDGNPASFVHRWQDRRRLVAPGPARAFVNPPPAPPHWGINE